MISEPDPAKVERAMYAYRVFGFAIKAVTAGLGVEPSSEQYEAIWRVVQQVAARDTTLNASPAEIMPVEGAMTAALRAAFERNIAQVSREEAEIAATLLAASQGFYTPPSGK